MRTGFRNDADKGCQQYHEYGVVADPLFDVDILQSYTHDQQDSESPSEYRRKVSFDDMVPEVILYEMVGSEQKDEKHDDAEAGEQYVHPVFAEEVDGEGSFTSFRMTRGVFRMTVVTCFGMYMAFMGSMVVTKVACSQGSDEYGKADEHDDSFPSEMSFAMAVSFGMSFVMIMYDIAVMAVCLRSASIMVMLRAS